MHDMAPLLSGLGLLLVMTGTSGCGPEPSIDDDVSPVVDATAVGDDDGTSGDDDSGGDDDATMGDDDVSIGDDDVTAGDDDVTVGDDDISPTPASFEDCSDLSRDFWAGSSLVMSTASASVPSTCRLAGPTVSVYVADDQWQNSVTSELVEAFLLSLEYRAPSGAVLSGTGILGNNREVFGEPPDIDGDGRLFVLMLDIPDVTGTDGSVASFDGYFNPNDQLADEVVLLTSQGKFHSNEAEVLYLNSRLQPVDSDAVLSATARELQQLIHYRYDATEEVWMNDSLGYIGPGVNGLFTDMAAVQQYAAATSIPLVTRQGAGGAGSYVLWGMYLFEQLGVNFMLTLEDEAQDGINGLNRALSTAGIETDFATLFNDWIVANAVDDSSLGAGHYGYSFTDDLPPMTPVARFTGPGGTYEGAVRAYGVHYIEMTSINSNSTLSVTSPDYNALVTRLIKKSTDGSVPTEISSLRLNPQGTLTASLEGGYKWSYLLAVTNANSSQIDTAETLGYVITVQ